MTVPNDKKKHCKNRNPRFDERPQDCVFYVHTYTKLTIYIAIKAMSTVHCANADNLVKS